MIYKYGAKAAILPPPLDGLVYVQDGEKGGKYLCYYLYRRKVTDREQIEYGLEYAGEVQE